MATLEHEPRAPVGVPPAARTLDRVVSFRLRSVLAVLGVILGVGLVIEFFVLAQAGLTLIAIALFVALALDPAVDFFVRRGLSRGAAVAAVFVLALLTITLLGLVIVPPLVDQISRFVDALPELVGDLTRGAGPLGFLETKYHVVERVREATTGQASSVTGAAAPVLSIVQGVATTVIGLIIIAFLTLFMLLEGPEWRRWAEELIPQRNRAPVARIGAGIYKAVGGFMIGNLLASFLAGVVAAIILIVAGVPYAVPLGLFVVLIELIPYVGPLVATIVLSAVALTQGVVPGLIVFGCILVYHMLEGHTLRPMIYGRAVRLSPLAVLIAIVLGTEIAGILGALAAIPVAGTLQVLFTEVITHRDSRAMSDFEIAGG